MAVAKAKDDFESLRFYKMLAYIKKNKDTNPDDGWVKQFIEREGNNPDAIQVPEEFKDVDLEGGEEL